MIRIKDNLSDKMLHTLILLYKDYHGFNLIKAIKTKLSPQFNSKDDANKQHKHDLDFLVGNPFTAYTDSYIGETTRRLNERVVDHAGKDTKSHIVRNLNV